MSSFEGKNVLVVGGTSGIGKAIVDNLAQQGAFLWVVSRTPSDSSEQVRHISLDVTDMQGKKLEGMPDQLHGLVYCPGTITLKPFQALKAEDFLKDYQINVLGAVNILQACLNALKKAEGASVVLFSTVAATVGMNYHTSIAAAKSALEGLGKSLAAELASKMVRVNLIAPSLTDTPLARQLLSTDEKKEASKQRHPLGRYGKPTDIGSMAVYLLSDESSWISGQVMHVDGGLSSLRPL